MYVPATPVPAIMQLLLAVQLTRRRLAPGPKAAERICLVMLSSKAIAPCGAAAPPPTVTDIVALSPGRPSDNTTGECPPCVSRYEQRELHEIVDHADNSAIANTGPSQRSHHCRCALAGLHQGMFTTVVIAQGLQLRSWPEAIADRKPAKTHTVSLPRLQPAWRPVGVVSPPSVHGACFCFLPP